MSAYVVYSLALTAVVYPVVTKRVSDYRGRIAAEDPYRVKSHKYLSRRNFVHAFDGDCGLTIVFELLTKIGHTKTRTSELGTRSGAVLSIFFNIFDRTGELFDAFN